MADRIYDHRVSQYENKISYGTLAILEQLAVKSTDNPINKFNHMFVNGGTIVRNCYENGLSDKDILDRVAYEFELLHHYYEVYAELESILLIYFHPGINSMIPEHARKKETPSRLAIDRLISIIVANDSFRPNVITKLPNTGQYVNYYGLLVANTFSYRALLKFLQTSPIKSVPKFWLVTHCPIDYLLLDSFLYGEIIASHTGKIIKKDDLAYKVFKDETIPFNRTTYKLFGDNDFIRAQCRNKPKAMSTLKGINLKLKTERELIELSKSKLGVDTKLLSWSL